MAVACNVLSAAEVVLRVVANLTSLQHRHSGWQNQCLAGPGAMPRSGSVLSRDWRVPSLGP